MAPADYMPFVTPVLLVGIFMWMWREHRELRSYFDSRLDKADERINGLQSNFDSRFDKVDERFDKVDERFDKVDERFDKVDERFDKVDERFDKVDERFEGVNGRFEGVNGRFDGLQSEMRADFRVFHKSLNELSMRVGRLEGVVMHTYGGALYGD